MQSRAGQLLEVMLMTEAEFVDWVKKLERMQEELATMQSVIVRELAEQRQMMQKLLAALEYDRLEAAALLKKGKGRQ